MNPSAIKRPFWILPVIVVSQFAGTALWFSGNAVVKDLQQHFALGAHALSYMTSAVQLGFIAGTLMFAVYAVSDRFSPRKVFAVCSLCGAIANAGIFLVSDGLTVILMVRFITGIFLAGIYPVGMKIASGWYEKGLGNALGFLIGALVMGTAIPHFIKAAGHSFSWQGVMASTSAMATTGGVLMLLLVPDGPYLFKGRHFSPKAVALIFKSGELRSAAFGYFGHMFELYAMWAYVPVMLSVYLAKNPAVHISMPAWSFWVIAAGSVGCIAGGVASRRLGSTHVAFFQLMASGVCCFLSPFIFNLPVSVFLAVLVFWGVVVVGDSPQFSAVIARTAPGELVGSALTIVNCIGFSITIFSIQLVGMLMDHINNEWVFLVLGVGPVMGMMALRPLLKSENRA